MTRILNLLVSVLLLGSAVQGADKELTLKRYLELRQAISSHLTFDLSGRKLAKVMAEGLDVQPEQRMAHFQKLGVDNLSYILFTRSAPMEDKLAIRMDSAAKCAQIAGFRAQYGRSFVTPNDIEDIAVTAFEGSRLKGYCDINVLDVVAVRLVFEAVLEEGKDARLVQLAIASKKSDAIDQGLIFFPAQKKK